MNSSRSSRGLAVVTGASAGLGQSFARELARRGHDLLLVARRADRLATLSDELCAQHGCNAVALVADLARPEGPTAVIEAMAKGPCPTLVVNNAGFGHHGRSLDVTTDRAVDMLRLNIEAVTRITLDAARRMVAEGRGGVVNVSSAAAFAGSPYFAVYGATKGYQLLFSEALNVELKGTGVRVFTFCPGYTTTEFHELASKSPAKTPPAAMIASPDDAVRDALDAYDAGRTTYVHGPLNKVSVFMQRLMPRATALAMAAKMFAPS